MNDKMTAMLDSMSWTGTSLKRLYDACVTSSRLSKKKKTKVAEASADEEVVQGYGDESDSSSDSSTLRKMAPKITDLRKSTEPSDKLLDEIAEDFEDDENTTTAVTQKLGDFVNKRFSTTLSEEKLKKKLGKHTRPENCDKFAIPKINPEIWMKLGGPVRRQDLQMVSVQRTVVKASLAVTQSAEMCKNPHQCHWP